MSDGGPHEYRVGFTSELGLAVGAGPDPGTLTGRVAVVPELCVPEAGVIRPSVLITWADILTGSLANEFTLPQVCMTVDLDVRILRPILAGVAIEGFGRIVKSGRTVTVGETTFTADGEPAAVSFSSFVASPRPEDVAVSAVTGKQKLHDQPVIHPPAPVAEMLGTRIVEPGVVEVDRRERILNWADTVQGGAVAALVEEAAPRSPAARCRASCRFAISRRSATAPCAPPRAPTARGPASRSWMRAATASRPSPPCASCVLASATVA